MDQLIATVHFRRGQSNAACSSFTVSPNDALILEAIVAPALASYDLAFPQTPAALDGPFDLLRIQYWGGPRPSAAVSRPCRLPRLAKFILSALLTCRPAPRRTFSRPRIVRLTLTPWYRSWSHLSGAFSLQASP